MEQWTNDDCSRMQTVEKTTNSLKTKAFVIFVGNVKVVVEGEKPCFGMHCCSSFNLRRVDQTTESLLQLMFKCNYKGRMPCSIHTRTYECQHLSHYTLGT